MRSIAIAYLFLFMLACQKEETPEPEQKFIEVQYCYEFERATDFVVEGSHYDGNFKDTVRNTKVYVRGARIEDKPDRTSDGQRPNLWAGACVFKAADKNNIKMKVSCVIGTDTLKKCTLGSCCKIN